MFKTLGFAVVGYVVYGLATRSVYARSRASGRTFYRDQEPFKYWCAISSYVVLALLLLFVF
jgi:hypothetical protein